MLIHQNKSQITLFFLLGFLFLLFIMFFLLLVEKKPESSEDKTQTAIQQYVESCLTQSLENALEPIMIHGGYYLSQNPSFIYYNPEFATEFAFSYYIYNNTPLIPTKETIEEQLSLGSMIEMERCLNLSIFPASIQGNFSEASIVSSIAPNKITQRLTFPIHISTSTATTTLEIFQTEVETQLLSFYSLALLMTEDQLEHPEALCLSCILTLGLETEIKIDTIEIAGQNRFDTVYFLSKDDELFSFVHGLLLGSSEDTSFSLQNKECLIGYTCEIKIDSFEEEMTFSDDSPFFDINEQTGKILFVPGERDVGSSIVTITAINQNNKTVSASFVLTIKDIFVSALQVEPLPYFTATIGQPFYYEINASSNYSLSFIDDTPLFTVHPTTGVINFTPTQNNQGEHDFSITVLDASGNYNLLEGYLYVVSLS